MKKLLSVLLAGTLLVSAATPIAASSVGESGGTVPDVSGEAAAPDDNNTQIAKGTPVIDGSMDDLYLQNGNTFFLDENNLGNIHSTWNGEYDLSASANLLWDDEYLYMYVNVADEDICTRGQEYINTEVNPWENDAVEAWFMLNGETCKVHSDAYGYTMFSVAEGSNPAELFDMEQSVYKTTVTETGSYTIEAALKLKTALTADETIGFCLQVNDIQTAEGNTIYCSGSQHPEENLYILTSDESDDTPAVPATPAKKGTVPKVPDGQITVDGELNEQVWNGALQIPIDRLSQGEADDTHGIARMLWADGSWYLHVQVFDADVVEPDAAKQATEPWFTDSVEMFFDFHEENGDIHQFRLDCSNYPSYYKNASGDVQAYGPTNAAPYFDDYAVARTSDGYGVEMRVNLDKYNIQEGDAIGLQLQINNQTEETAPNNYNVYNMASAMNAASWESDKYDYVVLGADVELIPGYAARKELPVYQNTPTIDGTLASGEWDNLTNGIALTDTNSVLWMGDAINNEVSCYFNCDNTGLYLAADIVDDSVVLTPDAAQPYLQDAFQVALDPGGHLAAGGEGGGMFYSIGPAADGTLAAVYHPYGGTAETFNYTGAYSITDNGWQFEILIPWTSIEILADDGYEWTHGKNQYLNAMICMLDREADGSSICYKTSLADAATSFNPTDYPLKLTLRDLDMPAVLAPTYREMLYIAASGAPTVDGEIDSVWSTAAWANIDHALKNEDGLTARAKVMRDGSALYILAEIGDPEIGGDEIFEVYLDEDYCRVPGEITPYCDHTYQLCFRSNGTVAAGVGCDDAFVGNVVKAYEVKAMEGGYVLEIMMQPVSELGDLVGLEFMYNDSNYANTICWNFNGNDASEFPFQNNSAFGTLVLDHADIYAPALNRGLTYTSADGTPVIDGAVDDAWNAAAWTAIDQKSSSSLTDEVSVRAKLLNDDTHLYLLAEVTDPDFCGYDGVVVYLDEDHCGNAVYCETANHIILRADQFVFVENGDTEKKKMVEQFKVEAVEQDDGTSTFYFECAIKPVCGIPTEGTRSIGLELGYDDQGMRFDSDLGFAAPEYIGSYMWNSIPMNGAQDPWTTLVNHGTLVLAEHVHTLTSVSKVHATCTSTGIAAHYVCDGCGKTFADENAETVMENVVIAIDAESHTSRALVGEFPATEDAEGYTGDLYCLSCGTRLSIGSTIPKLPATEPEVPETPADPAEPEEEPKEQVPIEEWEIPYVDIPEEIEADPEKLEAIRFVTENEYMIGTSTDEENQTFELETVLDRGQFVTILARMANAPADPVKDTGYSDVKADDYYAPFVAWANENEIIFGYGDGSFGASDALTVEQAIVILSRFSAYQNKQKTEAAEDAEHKPAADLSVYSDAAEVSDWAADALAWAIENGLYEANEDGTLAPKALTSRMLTAMLVYLYDSAL